MLVAQRRSIILKERTDELYAVVLGDKPLPSTQQERDEFVRDSMLLAMHVLRADLLKRNGKNVGRTRHMAALQIMRTGEKLLGLAGAGAVRRSRGLTPTGLPPVEHSNHETAAMRVIRQARGGFQPIEPPDDGDDEQT